MDRLGHYMLYTDGEGDDILENQYPCQICCFVSIGLLDPDLNDHLVDSQAITEGHTTLVNAFKKNPTQSHLQ